MKTKSGIYVDVTERPGVVVLSVQSSPPAEPSASTLARIINGLADKRAPTEVDARGFITGHQPGWAISLKPLGAKRVAEGLKPVAGILTVEETRTLRGLLRDARRWAERPPMLTYVEGGEQLRDELRHLAHEVEQAVVSDGGAGIPQGADWSDKLKRLAERVSGRIALAPVGCLTRSRVTRESLAALRAAQTAAPETDASPGDPDLRWARRTLSVQRADSPEPWEPCASTDDGAVLVVLP